jgi:CrcB protein
MKFSPAWPKRFIRLMTSVKKASAFIFIEGAGMRKVLLIAAGGSIGAILRYLIGEAYSGGNQSIFSTLIINIAGCFILSVILSEAFKRFNLGANITLGIATGLLGAFTTFSKLCRGVSQFIYERHYLVALLYAVVSVLLGIAAVYLGARAAKRLQDLKPRLDTDNSAEECRENGEI